MFATLESFSIFFFIGLALIVLGVIFEEKLIAIENKIAKKVRRKKAIRKHASVNKVRSCARKSVNKTSVSGNKRRIAA